MYDPIGERKEELDVDDVHVGDSVYELLLIAFPSSGM
tara:strand:- start:308 stop:418 length:111 start_codon:yes stop_codon:yes gene_type:complete